MKNVKMENKLLQCQTKIFGKKKGQIAKMYDNNSIFYEWMAKYAQFQLGMSDFNSICFDNFLIILDGVALCIEHCDDVSFSMLDNQKKTEKF